MPPSRASIAAALLASTAFAAASAARADESATFALPLGHASSLGEFGAGPIASIGAGQGEFAPAAWLSLSIARGSILGRLSLSLEIDALDFSALLRDDGAEALAIGASWMRGPFALHLALSPDATLGGRASLALALD
jgi:hypothetical protein